VETRHKLFGHVESRDKACRFSSKEEGSQIIRGKGRLRKTIRETFSKDLGINELDRDTIYRLRPVI
jgi:hypothetical protein